MKDKDRGLHQKYIVGRTDGKSVGFCLVLELKDPNAWPAMLEYARTVREEGYVTLAEDLERTVDYEMLKAEAIQRGDRARNEQRIRKAREAARGE